MQCRADKDALQDIFFSISGSILARKRRTDGIAIEKYIIGGVIGAINSAVVGSASRGDQEIDGDGRVALASGAYNSINNGDARSNDGTGVSGNGYRIGESCGDDDRGTGTISNYDATITGELFPGRPLVRPRIRFRNVEKKGRV